MANYTLFLNLSMVVTYLRVWAASLCLPSVMFSSIWPSWPRPYLICIHWALFIGESGRRRLNTFIIKAWTVQKRNLWFFSKFNQNIVRWFQASFQRVLGVLVAWWCLVNFLKSQKKTRKIMKRFVKYHQVTSTPETLLKLAWNHLTTLWLNFEKNRRFFSTTSLNI